MLWSEIKQRKGTERMYVCVYECIFLNMVTGKSHLDDDIQDKT